ncbi:MAG: MotA/TolQ/ExbB proton channel family protein [Myxococcota bacterium]
MDIQERLTAFAMLGAGWVMWLLVVLSVVGLAIILERAYYFFASRDDGRLLQAALRKRFADGDLDGATKLINGARSAEARIVAAGLASAGDGPESAEASMAGERVVARSRMERNLAFLGTVGNNAPFVGLLGTVIGIIRAFQALHESAGQVSEGLMAEIGEALVATAIGLLVALPAVAAYNVFQRVIKGRLVYADAMGADLMSYLKRQQPKGGYRDAPEES